MTYEQIALDLRVAFSTVHAQAKKIYKAHRAKGRPALAQKLGRQVTKRESPKRESVAAGLKAGKKYNHIAEETGLTIEALRHHHVIIHPSYFTLGCTAATPAKPKSRSPKK